MMKPRVFVHDIGLIDYQEGWDYQEKLFKQSIDHKIAVRKGESSGPTTNHLLFCEHPHVYTLGKSGKNEHLLLDKTQLAEKKATFYNLLVSKEPTSWEYCSDKDKIEFRGCIPNNDMAESMIGGVGRNLGRVT